MSVGYALRQMAPPQVKDAARRASHPFYELAYRGWQATAGRHPHLERPIFLFGCPRSGTSIAALLFGRHPDVANLSEAGRIWDPTHYDDPEADHAWLPNRVCPEDARRLHSRFEFHRQLHRAERFVNKHPRTSVRLGYVDAVFPDALFVHIVRDGRAVARSILDMIEREPYRQQIPMGHFCRPPGWRDLLRDDPVEQAALQWRAIVEYVLDWEPRLGHRFFTLRYEELCRDPRASLARAFDFAGLPTDRRSLRWIPEHLEDRNARWQQAFTLQEIATLERAQGPLLTRLGYPLRTQASDWGVRP